MLMNKNSVLVDFRCHFRCFLSDISDVILGVHLIVKDSEASVLLHACHIIFNKYISSRPN